MSLKLPADLPGEARGVRSSDGCGGVSSKIFSSEWIESGNVLLQLLNVMDFTIKSLKSSDQVKREANQVYVYIYICMQFVNNHRKMMYIYSQNFEFHTQL